MNLFKPFIFIGTICTFAILITAFTTTKNTTAIQAVATNGLKAATEEQATIYDLIRLDTTTLSREAFESALQGLKHLQENGDLNNPDILSIIDFSLPSDKKRLFIIDLKNKQLLFNTLVSHGKNSGKKMAVTFSNQINSFKSSLGFYITGNTFNGEHGYSLRLKGTEAGINDNALNRGIIIHSASYVNEHLAKRQGYIGRSLGCPAIPPSIHKQVIQRIKNGTCLFLYSPDKNYSAHTKILIKDSTAS